LFNHVTFSLKNVKSEGNKEIFHVYALEKKITSIFDAKIA